VIEKDEIVKGYEHSKGQYVIEPSELNNLRVPSKHTIAVSQGDAEAMGYLWRRPETWAGVVRQNQGRPLRGTPFCCSYVLPMELNHSMP
jgi:hypothetical protein